MPTIQINHLIKIPRIYFSLFSVVFDPRILRFRIERANIIRNPERENGFNLFSNRNTVRLLFRQKCKIIGRIFQNTLKLIKI